MKTIVCEKCKSAVALINGLNCRVIRYGREDVCNHISITCVLGVYCAGCGEENTLTIKHFFDKGFRDTPTKLLVDIALCESGIVFGG